MAKSSWATATPSTTSSPSGTLLLSGWSAWRASIWRRRIARRAPFGFAWWRHASHVVRLAPRRSEKMREAFGRIHCRQCSQSEVTAPPLQFYRLDPPVQSIHPCSDPLPRRRIHGAQIPWVQYSGPILWCSELTMPSSCTGGHLHEGGRHGHAPTATSLRLRSDPEARGSPARAQGDQDGGQAAVDPVLAVIRLMSLTPRQPTARISMTHDMIMICHDGSRTCVSVYMLCVFVYHV